MKHKWIFILLSLFLSVQVFADEGCAPPPPIKDPFEPVNRIMFNFNDFLDNGFLKPAATIYNTIVPKPIVKAINNFFSNLNMVPTIANDVLQANLYQATSDTWRLGINSTLGILGFFDVAKPLGLAPHCEDLGLTFARWGWHNSYYLVIPFLGPSTIRDGIAWPINYQYLTVYPYINSDPLYYTLWTVGVVDKRAELLRYQSVFEQAAIDRYAFMRNAYLQHRNYQIEQNEHPRGV